MFLNNVYRVRVIENPIIKQGKKGALSLTPDKNSKSYEMYLLKVDNNSYMEFDDNNTTYLYCESVKDYIEKGLFQNTKKVIDFVSKDSLKTEFGFGYSKDIDIKKLKNTIQLFNERKINKTQLKKMLWNIVKEEEIKNYNYREID